MNRGVSLHFFEPADQRDMLRLTIGFSGSIWSREEETKYGLRRLVCLGLAVTAVTAVFVVSVSVSPFAVLLFSLVCVPCVVWIPHACAVHV